MTETKRRKLSLEFNSQERYREVRLALHNEDYHSTWETFVPQYADKYSRLEWLHSQRWSRDSIAAVRGRAWDRSLQTIDG